MGRAWSHWREAAGCAGGIPHHGGGDWAATIPPVAADLDRYMGRFAEAYDVESMSKIKAITAVAAAHHRFAWIHPFLDGNGKSRPLDVTRQPPPIGSRWKHMVDCSRTCLVPMNPIKPNFQLADQVRQGNLDGRGALSEKALIEFCSYFLTMSIDQVEFMESLLQPGELLRRMKLYCDDEVDAGRLPKRSMAMLKEAFVMGEFERRRAPEITGYQERRAREILSELLSRGLLVSTGPKKPVRLGFPLEVVERWFPSLYPVG